MQHCKTTLLAASYFINLLILGLTCCKAQAEPQAIAEVAILQGVLSVRHANGEQALLGEHAPVQANDSLTTEADSYARLQFVDDSVVIMQPRSVLNIDDYHYVPETPEQNNLVLRLLKGGLRKMSGIIGHTTPAQDKLITPVATIGIRGTQYGLMYCQADCLELAAALGRDIAEGLHIDVAEGEISVQNQQNSLAVVAGQFAYVGSLQHEPLLIPEAQSLQLNMPTVMMESVNPNGSLETPNHHGQCIIK